MGACSLVGLCGCGASTQSSTTTTTGTNASYLAGNWLLAGSMPTGYGVTSSALSVTATFDVSGSNVSGIVQVQLPCATAGALGVPLILQGTVVADGSFTLNSVAVAGFAQTFTLQGKAPSVAGGAWSGNFSFTNPGAACGGTTSGAVAAVSVPLISGTYLAMASLGNPLNNLLQGVALKLVLQQGGTIGSTGATSNLALSGTMTVSSSTCITSGTTLAAPAGGFVEGAQVGTTFTMNDGSTVLLDGQVTSMTGSTISALLITTKQGSCGLSFNISSPITLTR